MKKNIVERLKRIFTHLEIVIEEHYFNDDDYAPPINVDWYYVIEELKKNGLEIRNSKNK